jgi:chaperonin GroES
VQRRRRGRRGGFVGHRRHTVALPLVAPADLPDPGPDGSGLPIKMLADRILVQLEGTEGERRSSGGILIPATAQMGKRLAWAKVVAVGPNVRAMEAGDQVLFSPEDRYEVEVRGDDYIILRERDVHALAAKRLDSEGTGLYL